MHERRESHDPFLRRDFSLTDNEKWLVANVMQKTENGFRFERRAFDPGERHEANPTPVIRERR